MFLFLPAKFDFDFRYSELINASIPSIIKSGIAVLKWGMERFLVYNGNIIIPDYILFFLNFILQRLIKWNLIIPHPWGPEKKMCRLWSPSPGCDEDVDLTRC